MRKTLVTLGLLGLFAIGPIASRADDGSRLVAVTLAQVKALLGSGSTAQTNLGLGTASTQNTGTSGGNVPLLNQANTWSSSQTFSSGLSIGANISTPAGAGVSITNDDSSAYLQIYGSTSGAPGYLGISGKTISFQPPSTGVLTFNSIPVGFAKLSAVPTTAPGAGRVTIYAVAGTNTGTCKLQVMAGTSTTPSTILDNIGAGC